MWVLGQRNHVVGNRFPNHNNGMFFDAGGGQGGGGLVARGGKVCTNEQQLGRVQGNTNRGNARFGTYFLGPNYPKDTTQSLANDGMETDLGSCAGFLADGSDNGVSTLLFENVDEGNAFTGQYELGDIQYAGAAMPTLAPTLSSSTPPSASASALITPISILALTSIPAFTHTFPSPPGTATTWRRTGK